jgi:hypothetical protein
MGRPPSVWAAWAALIVVATLSCGGGPTTSPDAGASSGGTGASAALVAQCESLASTLSAGCMTTNDASRACFFTAYGKLCSTGNTKLLVDAMNCVSGATCRSFSDPNDSATCLAQAAAADETPASRANLETLCMACGGSDCATITGTGEIVPYLPDSELASLIACVGTTHCSASQLASSCAGVPDVAPFAACPQ